MDCTDLGWYDVRKSALTWFIFLCCYIDGVWRFAWHSRVLTFNIEDKIVQKVGNKALWNLGSGPGLFVINFFTKFDPKVFKIAYITNLLRLVTSRDPSVSFLKYSQSSSYIASTQPHKNHKKNILFSEPTYFFHIDIELEIQFFFTSENFYFFHNDYFFFFLFFDEPKK